MSIAQFLRILMARRMVMIATLLLALVGAVALSFVLRPRYPATARILMDVIKPDPVSGQVISSSFVRGYTRTQIELITDYRVAGDVVDKLGWERDPLRVADFKANSNGTEDFRRYEARGIIEATDAKLVEGSNILEISYYAGNPIVARNVVTALRSAFIDASLRFRTDAAGRSADWYVDQAKKAQDALAAAEAAKSAFERTNGIVMAPGGADSETIKLESMQSAMLAARSAAGMLQGGVELRADQSGPVVALKAQINAMDDAIAQASQRLGTSHPTYIAMTQRRALLQQQLGRETALAHSQGGSTVSATQSNASRLEAEVAAQKAKVLSLKPQLNDLAQLQREVDLRRIQYEKAAARAADLKLEADVSETGLVPLNDAVVSGVPTFPNKPLILALGAAGGLALGIVLAIITELVSRRIRGPEDLAHASKVAVLAVIAGPETLGAGRRVLRFFHLGGKSSPASRLLPAP
jgi:succinoglycan biosynthesis transport protein ExoP